jgi:hypothetical protein
MEVALQAASDVVVTRSKHYLLGFYPVQSLLCIVSTVLLCCLRPELVIADWEN